MKRKENIIILILLVLISCGKRQSSEKKEDDSSDIVTASTMRQGTLKVKNENRCPSNFGSAVSHPIIELGDRKPLYIGLNSIPEFNSVVSNPDNYQKSSIDGCYDYFAIQFKGEEVIEKRSLGGSVHPNNLVDVIAINISEFEFY